MAGSRCIIMRQTRFGWLRANDRRLASHLPSEERYYALNLEGVYGSGTIITPSSLPLFGRTKVPFQLTCLAIVVSLTEANARLVTVGQITGGS